MSNPVGLFSDTGQAALACRDAFQDKFIHVSGVGWLTYTGRVWREVDDKVPLAALRRWTAGRTADVARDPTADHKLITAWSKRLDTFRLRNALTLAQGFEGISVEPEQLDANPDLLNCRNGVVYLPTGDLTPHLPELYLTKCTNVDYDPRAVHDDLDDALQAIPESVREWLKVRFGQAITGHTCPDDRVVIQQGGGANGKSTVLAAISAALGDYYFLASDKILMGGQNGAHTTDLADLRGTRFVAIEETPEAGRLDVVRLKKVAGTARVTARRLYHDNVSFPASHTLFVNTNYPPVVGETDEGTWRRLYLVVYPYTFTGSPQGENERQGDPRLRERLSGPAQSSAALAWLIEGAGQWYAQDRGFGQAPERVLTDTEGWKDSTDHVAAFWNDHLDSDPESYVTATDLIWLFNIYMRHRGNAGLAESTFIRRFATHAITAGALVRKTRISNGPRQTLKQSRPSGALDPFSRLPGTPTGQVYGWVGLAFRPTVDVNTSWQAPDLHERG